MREITNLSSVHHVGVRDLRRWHGLVAAFLIWALCLGNVSASPTSRAPAPRTWRLAVPAGAEVVEILSRFARLRPEWPCEIVPMSDDTAALASLRAGSADLALYRGILPLAEVEAFPYRQESLAAVVPFATPLEAISLVSLRALLQGDAATRDALGIAQVVTFDTLPWRLLGLPEPAPQAHPTAAAWLAGARSGAQLALLPYEAVRPWVRALCVEGQHPTDSDYPLRYTHAVLATPDAGSTEVAAALAAFLRAEQSPPVEEITIAAVGDIMLARDVADSVRRFGASYPFAHAAPILQAADIAVGNLECVISMRGEPANKYFVFRAPPETVVALRRAGLDLVTLANNHILDYGPVAFYDTLRLLEMMGIRGVGAGRNEQEALMPVVMRIKGVRLAFLAFARYPPESIGTFQGTEFVATADQPGIAWAEIETISAAVAAAKREVDQVIVALHAGYEYLYNPSEFQRAAARAAIDAGASLVLGHHSHTWQPIEFYGDGVILYSMGNFVFDQESSTDTAIATLRLDRHGVRQIELTPMVIVGYGQPAPPSADDARRILDDIYRLSQQAASH